MTAPTDNLRIEPMTRDDVPRVHQLELLCFSSPWTIEAYYGELRNPTAYYLVARLDGHVVGFGGMWAIDDEAHIVTLAVQPEYRRHGIGRRLLVALLDDARTRQVNVVTLEVRVGNLPAQGLYTALGFKAIARRKRYYPDNNEDALVMALKL